MHSVSFVATLLALTLPALAQEGEGGAGSGPPTPTAEHKHLELFAGTWEVDVKMTMPGQPAVAGKLTEAAKMVSNGFWLASRVDGEFGGGPFQGRGLMGYDTNKNKFVGLWVDSMGPSASTSEGTYDAKTKTLTTQGEMPGEHGKLKTRSVAVLKSADLRTETIYATGPDGKEFTMMEMTAKRQKAAPANSGAASAAIGDVSPEHKELHRTAGAWDCIVKMDMPPGESKATETVTIDCGGLWLLSEFRGDFFGMPFEGNLIAGYDPTLKQYVSWWADSMSSWMMHSRGTSKDGVLTMTGSSYGMDGKPVKTNETQKWLNDNERVFTMVTTTEDGKPAGTMTIQYRRQGNTKAAGKSEKAKTDK